MSKKREAKSEKRKARGTETAADSPSPEGFGEQAVKRELMDLPVGDCFGTTANSRNFNPKHPRFLELVPDVRANGVLEPVHARPADSPMEDGLWEILAGRRRLEAAKAAGRETIPAIVYHELSDEDAHKITVKENFNRDDLTPIEESRAVRLILADNGHDYKAAASFFGRPERWVHLRAKLADLDASWLKLIEDPEFGCSVWTAGHLDLIARFPTHVQKDLAKNYENEFQLRRNYAVSVKNLQAWIDDGFLRRLKSAPFDIEDATLVSNAPACSSCKKRASCQGMLFLEEEEEDLRQKNDQCTDAACWNAKVTAAAKAKLAALETEHGKVLLVTEGYDNHRVTAEMTKTFGRGPDATGLSFSYNKHRIARKKADKARAQVGMWATGPKAGKVVYILPDGDSRQGAKAKSTADGKAKKTPLKERRAVLESKRWGEVLKRLSDRVEKLQLEDLPLHDWPDRNTMLVAMVAAFGTNGRYPRFGSDYRDAEPRPGESYAANKSANPHKLLAKFAADNVLSKETLWTEQLRPLFVRRLYCNLGITKTPRDAVQEAKDIAALCGIDVEAIYAEACEVYKEPRSWANLNADGTAKTAKSTTKSTKDAKKEKKRETA